MIGSTDVIIGSVEVLTIGNLAGGIGRAVIRRVVAISCTVQEIIMEVPHTFVTGAPHPRWVLLIPGSWIAVIEVYDRIRSRTETGNPHPGNKIPGCIGLDLMVQPGTRNIGENDVVTIRLAVTYKIRISSNADENRKISKIILYPGVINGYLLAVLPAFIPGSGGESTGVVNFIANVGYTGIS